MESRTKSAQKDFLPSIPKRRLVSMRAEETDGRYRRHYDAAIMRKDGSTIGEIAEEMSVQPGTVANWLRRMAEQGPGANCKIRQGRQPKLTPIQLQDLEMDMVNPPRQYGLDSDGWTSRVVAQHVLKKFNVEITPGSMRRIMTRTNLRWPGSAAARKHPEQMKRSYALEDLHFLAKNHALHDGEQPDGDLKQSSFESILRDLEDVHGPGVVWSTVRNILFSTTDEFVQRRLIEYCGYRRDKRTDKLRHRILSDAVGDTSLSICSQGAAIVCLGEFPHVEPRLETLKRLYDGMTDSPTRQELSYHILSIDLSHKSSRNMDQIVYALCSMCITHDYAHVAGIVREHYMRKYDGEDIKNVLEFVSGHPYSTEISRKWARRFMKNVYGAA